MTWAATLEANRTHRSLSRSLLGVFSPYDPIGSFINMIHMAFGHQPMGYSDTCDPLTGYVNKPGNQSAVRSWYLTGTPPINYPGRYIVVGEGDGEIQLAIGGGAAYQFTLVSGESSGVTPATGQRWTVEAQNNNSPRHATPPWKAVFVRTDHQAIPTPIYGMTFNVTNSDGIHGDGTYIRNVAIMREDDYARYKQGAIYREPYLDMIIRLNPAWLRYQAPLGVLDIAYNYRWSSRTLPSHDLCIHSHTGNLPHYPAATFSTAGDTDAKYTIASATGMPANMLHGEVVRASIPTEWSTGNGTTPVVSYAGLLNVVSITDENLTLDGGGNVIYDPVTGHPVGGPTVVTSTPHSFVVGSIVRFAGVVGPTGLNGAETIVVAIVSPTSFKIGTSTLAYATHTANTGTVERVLRADGAVVVGVTQQAVTANTPVMTFQTSRNYHVGDKLQVCGFFANAGMQELNDRIITVTSVIDPCRISFNVDTSGYSAYTMRNGAVSIPIYLKVGTGGDRGGPTGKGYPVVNYGGYHPVSQYGAGQFAGGTRSLYFDKTVGSHRDNSGNNAGIDASINANAAVGTIKTHSWISDLPTGRNLIMLNSGDPGVSGCSIRIEGENSLGAPIEEVITIPYLNTNAIYSGKFYKVLRTVIVTSALNAITVKLGWDGSVVWGAWLEHPAGDYPFLSLLPFEYITQLHNELEDRIIETGQQDTKGPINPWICMPMMGLMSIDPDYTAGENWPVNAVDVMFNGANGYRGIPGRCVLGIEMGNENFNVSAAGGAWNLFQSAWRWRENYYANGVILRSSNCFNDLTTAYPQERHRLKYIVSVWSYGLNGINETEVYGAGDRWVFGKGVAQPFLPAMQAMRNGYGQVPTGSSATVYPFDPNKYYGENYDYSSPGNYTIPSTQWDIDNLQACAAGWVAAGNVETVTSITVNGTNPFLTNVGISGTHDYDNGDLVMFTEVSDAATALGYSSVHILWPLVVSNSNKAAGTFTVNFDSNEWSGGFTTGKIMEINHASQAIHTANYMAYLVWDQSPYFPSIMATPGFSWNIVYYNAVYDRMIAKIAEAGITTLRLNSYEGEVELHLGLTTGRDGVLPTGVTANQLRAFWRACHRSAARGPYTTQFLAMGRDKPKVDGMAQLTTLVWQDSRWGFHLADPYRYGAYGDPEWASENAAQIATGAFNDASA